MSNILSFTDLKDKVTKDIQSDLRWPWPRLDKMTDGLRKGELITLCSFTGAGKSEFLVSTGYHICANTPGIKGLIISFEQEPEFTYKRLISKSIFKRIDKSDHGVKVATILEHGGRLPIDTWDTSSVKSWDSLYESLKKAQNTKKYDYIIIDNLSNLASFFSKSSKNLAEVLGDVTIAIKDLARATNTVIFLVSHVSRNKTKGDFDRGAELSLGDIRSSEGIAQHSDYVFGLERDTLAKDKQIRNYCVLRCLKDRVYGHARGEEFYFRYDHETGDFSESDQIEESIYKDLFLSVVYRECVEKFNKNLDEFKRQNKSFKDFFGSLSPTGFSCKFILGDYTLFVSDKQRPYIIFDAPYVLRGRLPFKEFCDKVNKAKLGFKYYLKQNDFSHQKLMLYFDEPEEFDRVMRGLLDLFESDTVVAGTQEKTKVVGFDTYTGIIKKYKLIERAEDWSFLDTELIGEAYDPSNKENQWNEDVI